MTINAVSAVANVVVSKDDPRPSQWFSGWLQSVFAALFGWSRSYTATSNINFGNIVAGGEATQVVTVKGSRQGDAVLISPKTPVAGLGCDGIVTANDMVTVRRFNFSAGAIDPAADDFRIVVLQQ